MVAVFTCPPPVFISFRFERPGVTQLNHRDRVNLNSRTKIRAQWEGEFLTAGEFEFDKRAFIIRGKELIDRNFWAVVLVEVLMFNLQLI